MSSYSGLSIWAYAPKKSATSTSVPEPKTTKEKTFSSSPTRLEWCRFFPSSISNQAIAQQKRVLNMLNIFKTLFLYISWWTDSNSRPADYKSAALPTELHQQTFLNISYPGSIDHTQKNIFPTQINRSPKNPIILCLTRSVG